MTQETQHSNDRMPDNIGSNYDRHTWISQNLDKIKEYIETHTLEEATKHFGLSYGVVMRIKHGTWKHRPVSKRRVSERRSAKSIPQPVPNSITPTEFAHAVMDRMLDLQSEVYVLRAKNKDLENYVNYLQAMFEEKRTTEHAEFNNKMQRVYAGPGEK